MTNYVNSPDPTLEDWLRYNEAAFKACREMTQVPEWAFLADAQRHAQQRGVHVRTLFANLVATVGDLGHAALKLVHNDTDDTWCVTLDIKSS